MTKYILVFLPLLLSGCVFSQQTAKLSPVVSMRESALGSGVTVAVNVVDERPDQSIGKRGVGGAGADIMPAEKVEVSVANAIVEGLRKEGFKVVGKGEVADAALNVEVRFLQYSVSMGFWSGGVNVKVALKAIASKNGKTYDRLYREDKEERVQIAPGAETNEKWINEALSKTIQQLLDDQALIDTLTAKG